MSLKDKIAAHVDMTRETVLKADAEGQHKAEHAFEAVLETLELPDDVIDAIYNEIEKAPANLADAIGGHLEGHVVAEVAPHFTENLREALGLSRMEWARICEAPDTATMEHHLERALLR